MEFWDRLCINLAGHRICINLARQWILNLMQILPNLVAKYCSYLNKLVSLTACGVAIHHYTKYIKVDNHTPCNCLFTACIHQHVRVGTTFAEKFIHIVISWVVMTCNQCIQYFRRISYLHLHGRRHKAACSSEILVPTYKTWCHTPGP